LTSFDPVMVDIQKYWSGTCSRCADSYSTYSYAELSGLIEEIRDFGDTSVMRDPERESIYVLETHQLSSPNELLHANNIGQYCRDYGQVDANDNWYTNVGYSIHVLRSGVSPSVNYRSVNMHVHDS